MALADPARRPNRAKRADFIMVDDIQNKLCEFDDQRSFAPREATANIARAMLHRSHERQLACQNPMFDESKDSTFLLILNVQLCMTGNLFLIISYHIFPQDIWETIQTNDRVWAVQVLHTYDTEFFIPEKRL